MVNKYRDLTLSFAPHPKTGDLSTVSDENSINQSLRNLIFYDFYDVPFQPKIGSNIRARLFDLITPMTADIIKADIKDVIENFEPRIEVVSVSVKTNNDKNGLDVTLTYTARTSTQQTVVRYFLERII